MADVNIEIPEKDLLNIFGEFDSHVKILEDNLGVDFILRGDQLKLSGEENNLKRAEKVFNELYELSKRGHDITDGDVHYALSLKNTQAEHPLVELDSDIICHTVSGKPVKPKTLGQKEYVDTIRKRMITFGVGPAGTGKTYLAMAIGITAFMHEEVERIILTRPAIEAGEKLGFLPGDLQSKIDP
ncbi:MAG: PhoH family protein, partial [Candidatus Weimeria sp.]